MRDPSQRFASQEVRRDEPAQRPGARRQWPVRVHAGEGGLAHQEVTSVAQGGHQVAEVGVVPDQHHPLGIAEVIEQGLELGEPQGGEAIVDADGYPEQRGYHLGRLAGPGEG